MSRRIALGVLAIVCVSLLPVAAGAGVDCRCLDNGGVPGPGDCLCNVGLCFARCVDELCPAEFPDCMVECSVRCSCNAEVHCPSHVDPGPTPTRAPRATPTVLCPPVVPPPTACAATDVVACSDYRCAIGCQCACQGDCNADRRVAIEELIASVAIALGRQELSRCQPAAGCAPAEFGCTLEVAVDNLVAAVGNALTGCAAPLE